MIESREQLFQRLQNDPAFEYIIERVIIALAPIFEEIEDLEDRLRRATRLAKLTESDLKTKDSEIDLEFASTVADTLADVTSVEEVRLLIKQYGAKSIPKLKKKKLVAFTREVQYKLSYLKAMSETA